MFSNFDIETLYEKLDKSDWTDIDTQLKNIPKN
jgi:hypothetical protein